VDVRDPQRAREFYARHEVDKNHDAETAPPTVDQSRTLFLEQAVGDFDYALVQTVPKSRSPIFENATEAAHAILGDYRKYREAAGREGPFRIRVGDGRTLFAGQGVLAAETMRLINAGMKVGDIRQRISDLTPKTSGYAVVPDLYYVHKRARKKGDKSVGFVGALMGSALDIKPILCARQDQTFPVAKVRGFRSEEHTSELQSRSDLVCRLLLEKKKQKNTETETDTDKFAGYGAQHAKPTTANNAQGPQWRA